MPWRTWAGLSLGLVGKVDPVELDRLLEVLEDDGALLFNDVILRIHEAEDLLAGTEGLLEGVVEERELTDGVVEGKGGDEEGDEGAFGHGVRFD